MRRLLVVLLLLMAGPVLGDAWVQYRACSTYNYLPACEQSFGPGRCVASRYEYTSEADGSVSYCDSGELKTWRWDSLTTYPCEGGADAMIEGTGQPATCLPPPPTQDECDELGLAYDGDAMACVDLEECTDGALGDGSGHYTCLADTKDPKSPNDSDDPNTNNECRKDSNDYKGVFNGKFYCDTNLPEAPSCQKGTSHIIDNGNGSYGFACAATPEEPGDAETEDKETTSVIENDEKRIERTVNEKTGAVTTKTTDKTTGETTVTITYPGTDSQTGKPCTEDSLLCYPSENTGFCKDGNSLCEDVKDIKEWLTDGDGIGDVGEGGHFDMDGINDKIAQAESELKDLLEQIKGEFGEYFDFDPTTGSLSCPYTFDVFDQEIALCPDEYKNELKVIGQLVMVLAAFIAFFMLARTGKE